MEPPGVLGHSNVPLTCITSTWSSYLSCNLFYLPSPRLRRLIGKRQLIPHLILNYWASSRLATKDSPLSWDVLVPTLFPQVACLLALTSLVH